MESGNNASGRPGALLPAPNSNPNAGLFQLTNAQGVAQEAVSLCRIASIKVTSETYSSQFTYLPAPTPAPTGCDADCQAAIREYLPVNTKNVSINSGGQTVAKGTVLKNEFGMLVIVGPNNSDPTFVSSLSLIHIWNKADLWDSLQVWAHCLWFFSGSDRPHCPERI